MGITNMVLPDEGELVMGSVVRIVGYGAYATLDEYNDVEGLLHISEISSRWVKNIRDHVREGQKTVLKVLRVDPTKLHVDLSLRRVSDRERKTKLLQWKQDNRGKQLLDLAAGKMQITPEEAYENIGKKIEEHFESIYLGLEKAVELGAPALIKCEIPSEWANVLAEIAKMKIKIPKIMIRGTFELSNTKPDGVNVLKNTYIKIREAKKPKGSNIRMYSIGAPKYRIEITANNYKEAEQLLEVTVQTALKTIRAEGGEGKFTRGLEQEA